ncbi:MAG: stress response translation initiation inhibitor YciH [Conexivisphaerales archaeon]|jgi:translation initiation factor 1
MGKDTKPDGTKGNAESETMFTDVLRELDAEESRITVRLELRRFRKKTTLVEGLSGTQGDINKVAHALKKKLATGGSVKDGIIVLQGDQRDSVKEILSRMGYPEHRIEVQ